MAGFDIDEETWLTNEKTRHAQKTLSNHIGNFHQSILGKIQGWQNCKTGNIIDLICPERKIIAEIKNKYNTIKGSDLIHLYQEFDNLVMRKNSTYKDYTAYYVEIIPKKPTKYNKPFTPSDKSKGEKTPENPLIRKTDGYTFYHLATGVEDALLQLFEVLPSIIEALLQQENYCFKDIAFLKKFFGMAFQTK